MGVDLSGEEGDQLHQAGSLFGAVVSAHGEAVFAQVYVCFRCGHGSPGWLLGLEFPLPVRAVAGQVWSWACILSTAV